MVGESSSTGVKHMQSHQNYTVIWTSFMRDEPQFDRLSLLTKYSCLLTRVRIQLFGTTQASSMRCDQPTEGDEAERRSGCAGRETLTEPRQGAQRDMHKER